MRCLVTAGPTHEPLDLVRRLTNFSTGRLGTGLADHLAGRGHSVTLFRGVTSTAPAPSASVRDEPFSSTVDLASRFLAEATDERVALFHAAAVSDFSVGLAYRRDPVAGLRAVYGSKLSTRGGPLLVELRPTPKLLAGLREWYPSAWIVGWKYETEGERDAAIERGRTQLAEAGSDACVVNGPAHGPGYTMVTADGIRETVLDAASLYELLSSELVRRMPS